MNIARNKIEVPDVIKELYEEKFIIGNEENYDQYFDATKQHEFGIFQDYIDVALLSTNLETIKLQLESEGRTYKRLEIRWNIGDNDVKFLYSVVGIRDETDIEYEDRMKGLARASERRQKMFKNVPGLLMRHFLGKTEAREILLKETINE